MGSVAEKLTAIHDGVTRLDSRVRCGLLLTTGTAANFILATTVQPAEVALGGIVLIAAATLVEGLHQTKNMEIRDDLTHTERG